MTWARTKSVPDNAAKKTIRTAKSTGQLHRRTPAEVKRGALGDPAVASNGVDVGRWFKAQNVAQVEVNAIYARWAELEAKLSQPVDAGEGEDPGRDGMPGRASSTGGVSAGNLVLRPPIL